MILDNFKKIFKRGKASSKLLADSEKDGIDDKLPSWIKNKRAANRTGTPKSGSDDADIANGNVSETLMEAPDFSFLDNEKDHSLEDMLKELGGDKPGAGATEENENEYIQSLLNGASELIDKTDAAGKAASSAAEVKSEPLATAAQTANPEESSEMSDFEMLFADPEDDLDSLIAAALEKDKLAGNESTFEDANREFINDTAVYQEEDPFAAPYTLNKPKSGLLDKFSNIPERRLVIVIIALSAFIIVIIALTVYIGLRSAGSRMANGGRSGGTLISQPESAINNANYIYLNLGVSFKDGQLVLGKILIDSLSTVFYFNSALDTEGLEITLTDGAGKQYAPLLAFKHLKRANAANPSLSNELHFLPLDENTNYFELNILDPDTGEETGYEFTLSGKIVLPESKYIGKSKDLFSGNPDFSVYIEGASFSSSGTRLYYSLRWSDATDGFQLGSDDGSQIILLTEDAHIVSPVSINNEYLFDDENMLLGRMDFAPPRNLSGNITVTFTNLYRKFELNTALPASQLFNYRTEPGITISLNEYELTLERAGWQAKKLILVCHSENTGLFAVSGLSQDNDNRVETLLDVKARIPTPGGEIVLDGKCVSSPMGTDIIFEAGDAYEKIRGVSYDSYVFDISEVYIKIDDMAASYDLNNYRVQPDTMTSYAINAIIEAFEKRLAFKSGEADINNLTGFSEELMSPEELLRDYEPVYADDTLYSAQILSLSIADDIAYAVIAEYWTATADGKRLIIERVHRVKAQTGKMGWIIISDEIIK